MCIRDRAHVETVETGEQEERRAVDAGGQRQAQFGVGVVVLCLLYTSPSPRDRTRSRMPSSA